MRLATDRIMTEQELDRTDRAAGEGNVVASILEDAYRNMKILPGLDLIDVEFFASLIAAQCLTYISSGHKVVVNGTEIEKFEIKGIIPIGRQPEWPASG